MNCINKAIAGQIQNFESYDDYMKKYYLEYANTIKNRTKAYREANIEVVTEKIKAYQKTVADKLQSKNKCPCGGRYTHANKSIHLKGKIHLEFIAKEEKQNYYNTEIVRLTKMHNDMQSRISDMRDQFSKLPKHL
jgi:hypothetical protein